MIRSALLTAALLAAFSAQADGFNLSGLLNSAQVLDHSSVIVATKNAHDADMCRGFDLTDSEILKFFKKAKPVESEALHHGFDWAPCEVEGHLLFQGQKLWFSINAAFTGVIEIAPDTYQHFGCIRVCRSIFNYGYDDSGNADAN